MDTSRKVLSLVLTASYGAFAGGMFFSLATFWMWGLGSLIGMPAGLIYGGVIGWKVLPLRDAIILTGGCLSGLAAANWISFAIDLRSPDVLILSFMAIVLSGLFCWFAYLQFAPKTRYWLAIFSVASFAFNAVMVFAIRS